MATTIIIKTKMVNDQEMPILSVENHPEVWGGSALANMRDRANELADQGETALAFDLRNVGYLEGGTFGLFSGLIADRGLDVYLLNPTEDVEQMEFFQQCCVEQYPGLLVHRAFRLYSSAEERDSNPPQSCSFVRETLERLGNLDDLE